jgi:hypothetical protein
MRPLHATTAARLGSSNGRRDAVGGQRVGAIYPPGRFEKQLRDQFEGDFKLSFNLAAPMLAGKPDAAGRPGKRAFSASWMMPLSRYSPG